MLKVAYLANQFPSAVEPYVAAEIEELKGESTLWESICISEDQAEGYIRQFSSPPEAIYGHILAGLKTKRANLVALSKSYQQAQALDYFHCELGKQAREALLQFQARGKGNGKQ